MRTACLFLLVACSAAAQSETYTIQPGAANSKLELRVAKTGLYRGKVHVFEFPKYSGMLRYDAANPAASEVRLTLDAAAIALKDEWLSEKDFREVQRYAVEEMLEAAKHPQITFVSSSVTSRDAAHFSVQGTLTIRGKSSPAAVNVTLSDTGEAGVLRFEGDSIVKLTDFGLKPPKALLGLIGTEDAMTFRFLLDARR